jgi:hypothetical protein
LDVPTTPMEREGGAPDPPGTPPAMAPLCRHWARKGRCDYGDRCRFRHERVPSDDPPSTSGGVEEGDATADDGTGHRPQQPQNQREGATRFGRRHHARNRNKAGDFRRWLVDTFGFDTLSSGEGILDVAGGKGELAFELRNISGIPVTVVDPRPMRLDRYVRRFRSGIYHRNQSQVASKLRRPQTSSLSAPTHLRMFLHKGVFDPSTTEETRRAATMESYALAHATRWSRRGLVETESAPTADIPGDIPARVNLDEAYRVPGAPVRHKTMFTRAPPSSNSSASVDLPIVNKQDVMNEDETYECDDVNTHIDEDRDAAAMEPIAMDSAETAATCERVLSGCSVVVGLHPDQATDAAVDFALAHGKPFAVVPCCTYARDFPHRRLPPGPGRPKGGGPVTTHAHLVEYLLAKAPGVIKSETLPFEGKNVVVYSLGGVEPELCRAVDGLEVGDT